VPREQYSLQEILKIVAPLAISFKASEALAQASNDPLHSEVSKEDSEFSSVRARDFLSGSQVIFDLYVRLGNGKYLKLLQAGDAFTVERLEGYLEKGVTHFYLRKETQEEYLRFCDHLASSILKIQKVPLHVQTAQILNHGEQVMGFFQNQGLSPLNMDYAKKFLANVGELLKRMDLEGNELFEGFFQDVAAYEHGVGTTMLASVLAEYLEIQMDKPLQIVGVAGMFHDIGLQELPEALRDEGRIGMGGSLSPQERILYQSHPKRGGEILSRLRGIEAGAIQAVEQHHMRTRGPGFPERNGIAPMNRVAEMIGISDEMNLLLKRKQADPSVEILMELERKVFPNFSRQITYAFRTAFFPRST
jgi:response regulator RpfG family c-di-GMP phosphodiesterase